ncbi:MAG: thioredoxin family protein [Gammaproteobacteria bacterium]|nr:thioredoxin family protein [Gammaproteobacteria bacterium]
MKKTAKVYYVFFLLTLLFISPVASASVQHVITTAEVVWHEKDIDGQPVIHLYFFWSKKCPHCLKARPDILEMDKEYPWLKVHSLELAEHPENIQSYINLAALLGREARSVPAFIFCGSMLTGYESKDTTGHTLTNYLSQCYQIAREKNPAKGRDIVLDINRTPLDVPLLGRISSTDYSLPVLTIIIAAMDAFNPCAFFVLLFLLSMMVHSRSRGRMALVGGIFVFISGALYFLFMTAWLNLFIYLGELSLLTGIAGCIAVAMAMISIKDFFWFKKGPSLTIADSEKPELFDRVRQLLHLDSTLTIILATVILAVVANSYELLCTAGFPMIYTRILTLESLPAASYYLYLLLYNLIYIIPLFIIVAVFTVKLGSRKLSEQEGRVLKLLSGVMMLMLGLLLLVLPQFLNNIVTAATLLTAAICVTWLIVKVTNRRVRYD